MGICAFVCESAMGTAEIAHELSKVRRARSRPLNHHGSGDPDSAADRTAQTSNAVAPVNTGKGIQKNAADLIAM
jgi:hypothetical protein